MPKRNYFVNQTVCDFAITSQTVAPEVITQELQIKPDQCYNKGDTYIGRRTGRVYTHYQNKWCIQSTIYLGKREDLSPHINELRNRLKGKVHLLEKYKQDPRLDLSCVLWVETEDAGIWFDLSNEELAFLQQICNRCSFSLLATDSLEGKVNDAGKPAKSPKR